MRPPASDVSCKGGGAIVGDVGQNALGALGPLERCGLVVPCVDELHDRRLQLRYAQVRAALELTVGEDGEPALNLVEPR